MYSLTFSHVACSAGGFSVDDHFSTNYMAYMNMALDDPNTYYVDKFETFEDAEFSIPEIKPYYLEQEEPAVDVNSAAVSTGTVAVQRSYHVYFTLIASSIATLYHSML